MTCLAHAILRPSGPNGSRHGPPGGREAFGPSAPNEELMRTPELSRSRWQLMDT